MNSFLEEFKNNKILFEKNKKLYPVFSNFIRNNLKYKRNYYWSISSAEDIAKKFLDIVLNGSDNYLTLSEVKDLIVKDTKYKKREIRTVLDLIRLSGMLKSINDYDEIRSWHLLFELKNNSMTSEDLLDVIVKELIIQIVRFNVLFEDEIKEVSKFIFNSETKSAIKNIILHIDHLIEEGVISKEKDYYKYVESELCI